MPGDWREKPETEDGSFIQTVRARLHREDAFKHRPERSDGESHKDICADGTSESSPKIRGSWCVQEYGGCSVAGVDWVRSVK